MPKLPRLSGREARKAFERADWRYVRHHGDHMLLTMPGKRTLSIPDYDELPTFLLRGLIRTAGMTVDEFLSLL
ncbi:MAG TPA: type II toxin-antitoxin system HicA family toxin [Chloroflexota bacterium]|jgi:predicted RNA binding protein YcfA (HicA-like mRNA interferase family)